MSDQILFTRLIEKLLKGEVVCRYASADEYERLQDEAYRQEVDHFLRRIGRSLRATRDETGYYAIYTNLDEGDARKQVRMQFREIVNQLEPLVRWLRLVTHSSGSSTPLRPGDLLRTSQLLAAVESAPANKEELERLARSSLLNTKASGPAKQLDAILKRLQEQGYLKLEGSSGSVYQATGKWAWLYEMMAYIADHEQLDPPEEQATQQELLG